MTALPHPDAALGLVASGSPGPEGVREQTAVKSDSLYGLFRVRLEELAAALKGEDAVALEVARARVAALLRVRELSAAAAQKRVVSFEAALAIRTPPEQLVPPMPSRGTTLAGILRDMSLELAKTPDRTQARAQRARLVLVAALEACGLQPEPAAVRGDQLIAAWSR
ncbi:MAG: hypothetical protein M3Y59_02915 [Myxococcota bacterium]|nr:hypothetical protein [Myxococcota bacterium]